MRRRRSFKVGEIDVRSGLEQRVGNYLNETGIKFDYECTSYKWQEYIPRAICGVCDAKGSFIERSYTPDYFLDGGIILEVKGRFTSHDRKIAAAMADQYPGLDLRLVFDKNNWLTKKKKKTYGDWCDSKNIPWILVKDLDTWFLDRYITTN